MTNRPAPPAMTWRPLGWEVRVPPGRYFLGDPCYAVPDEDWMPLLRSTTPGDGYFGDRPVGEVRGYQVLAFATKYGDGTYADADGTEYPVDAGLIGLVPAALAEQAGKYDLKTLGRWVTFAAEVTASSDPESGLLAFGDCKIDTDPDTPDGHDGQTW